MNFTKTGILEIDDEKIAFQPISLDQYPDGRSYLTAELLNIFNESNARRKNNKKIKNVIFNDPATIVLWEDGTKTVVKCRDGDKYSKEVGLAMCIAKKFLGNKGNFNETFKKYIGDEYTHGEEA